MWFNKNTAYLIAMMTLGMASLLYSSKFWLLWLSLAFVMLSTMKLSLLRVLLVLEMLALVSIFISAGPPLSVSMYMTLMIISVGEAVMGLSLLANSLRSADFTLSRAKT